MIYASLDNKKSIGEFPIVNVVADADDIVKCQFGSVYLPATYVDNYWTFTAPSFGEYVVTVAMNGGAGAMWATFVEITECRTYTVTQYGTTVE